jgi:hypothetical protein
MLENKNK